MSDEIRQSFHTLLRQMEEPPTWDDLTVATVARSSTRPRSGWLIAASAAILAVMVFGVVSLWGNSTPPDVADVSPVVGVWEMVAFTISGTTQDVLIGTNTPNVPWVRFDDGQMTGDTGCNHFEGLFSYEDGVVVFDGVKDDGFCAADEEDESLMQTDRAFETVVWGSKEFAVEVVDDKMAWIQGDDRIELVAIDDPPGPFPPFNESAAGEAVEDWWWRLLDRDVDGAIALSHPAGDFNFDGLGETVVGLDGALNVIVDRRISGTEDQPMTCYAVTDGQRATSGAAVFRLSSGQWMIWEMRPSMEGCLSLVEDVTFKTRDDGEASWVVSGCPGTDQGLAGGSGDALPPADSVLTLQEVEAIWGDRSDAMIIPRNGEGWVRTSQGVELVSVEDYLVRITIDDAAGCPGIPFIVEGVPMVYKVDEPGDVNGRLPTGHEFTIDFDPAFGPVTVEGISGAIILDLEQAGLAPADIGCEPCDSVVVGIMRFRRSPGTGASFESGVFRASSGDWTMSIAVYENILNGWDGVDVGGTMIGHIRPIENAGGLPAFELSGPFRWATDEEIPLQMEIDYGRFVVRRGCGGLAVACSAEENVQVIPAGRVFEPADPWDYQGAITVSEPEG